MKTKKLLAMLTALSIMAASAAATPVFAEEESNLVDISSTATMSTNGNDQFWPVAGAVDGKYPSDANGNADGETVDGSWKSYLAGIYGAVDGDYIQADMGQAQYIKRITVLNAHTWGSYGAGKVKNIQLSNDPEFTTYEEMSCAERIAPENTAWISYVDHKSEWLYSGDKAYKYIRMYGTPGSGETITNDSSYQAFVIQEMMIYAEKPSDEVANVAEGKYVSSSKFGMGSWDGGEHTVDLLVDGADGVYVSPLEANETEIITIDLLGDYTVKNVMVGTYGNDDPNDQFYIGEGGSIVVKAKKSLSDAGVELTHEMNGSSGFFAKEGGGYESNYSSISGEKYRYIEVHYTEGQGANDMRMTEVEVYAPAIEARDETKIAPVSFGKTVTAGKAPVFGSLTSGVTDKRRGGDDNTRKCYFYNTTGEEAWVAIDLGCAYPIEMVVADMDVGSVSEVIVSNYPDFSDENYLVDENGKWTVAEGEPEFFRYVKIVPTTAPSNASDTNPSASYWEVVVYSTPEAKEENSSLVNIAGKATLSTNGKELFYPLSNIVDGQYGTEANGWSCTIGGIWEAQDGQYIQADLGYAHDIKTIDIVNTNPWAWDGAGKVKNIQLSNDPNFISFVEMVSIERVAADNADWGQYVDHTSEWSNASNNAYRYVRVYATPGSWGNMTRGNPGENPDAFMIQEMMIYATEKSAELQNVLAGKTPTLTNGEWMFGSTNTDLTDGNNYTHGYASSALAVFELDYPMDIERVEIDLRTNGEEDEPNRHYEVYLSNTGTKEGALKLLGVEENHQQIALNTILLPVDSTYGYKYVLVGSESNFWGLTEVRAMSTGEYVEPEMPEEPEETVDEITNELTGEQAKDQVLTLTTSWSCKEAISKTVNFYIARYDNGALTDVKMSGNKTLSGKTGSETFTYTITSDVTAQTEFKGFVWEKGTLNPFV